MDNVKTRVLLVDDNLAVRKIAKLFLLSGGYHVEVADDGDEAVQLLAEQAFSVLITDMIMPGSLSGVELIVFTREHYPEIKSGLISGMSDNLVDRTQDNLQELKTLDKPITKAAICDFVAELMVRSVLFKGCLIAR
jgi:CheY-like chemotaxis protein